MICCIVPTYKARSTVCNVVRNAAKYVDLIIVVDDACPEQSGALVQEQFLDNEAVIVIRHPFNRGVGGAMKTGIAMALDLGATVIIKLDADDQMNADYMPVFAELFETESGLEYIKGNRFIDVNLMKVMPKARLFGNSLLSLLVKFSSGYWNVIDPTNGYIAFRRNTLTQIPWEQLPERYFFEIHTLCEMGLKKARIAEIDMPAQYGIEKSSLSIARAMLEFPPKLLKLWLKRVLLQYFLFDVNLGSLYLVFGIILTAGAVLFGGYEWVTSYLTNTPRTTGAVMLVVLPFLMGFQLLLNALMHDVQFSPKTTKVFVDTNVSNPTTTTHSTSHDPSPARNATLAFGQLPRKK